MLQGNGRQSTLESYGTGMGYVLRLAAPRMRTALSGDNAEKRGPI